MTPYAWTTTEILQATGGTLVAGAADAGFTGIGIDSRTIAADQLFVAIAGESHDGHRFVADVIDQGVGGVLVAEARLAELPMDRLTAQGRVCVSVADTTFALGALARFNRRRGPLSVLAVTGSNGKTSTRRLMEQVIGRQFTTLATTGNLNNHIGLPLTLFRLAPGHQAAVLELGMNHAGEISYLGGICEPDVGVITNVGPAHLEGLGSLANVARAKGELLATIRPGGTAVLNADDPLVAALGVRGDQQVVYFGTSPKAQVRAENIHLTDAGTTFTLIAPSGSLLVRLATPARVMVANALAAAAASEVVGVPLDRIKAGLEAFVPQTGRMGIRHLSQDIRLVDDSYNANPASMAAAVETLARMAARRRTIAVLGDMLELGDQSATLHRQVGRVVGDHGIDRLYVTGRFAGHVADGAREGGMASERIVCAAKPDLTEQLVGQLMAGDLVLVKGSRGMAMETVVAAVCAWADSQ
jgi:UDP-N-acetylmuramoyl-tripeptide--D-alanyl-D-alanine ligase